MIPGVDRLITQLDRKTQEVEIEARVVAATRSFARDIGTQLGFGWGNGVSSVGGAGRRGHLASRHFRPQPALSRGRHIRAHRDYIGANTAVLEPARDQSHERSSAFLNATSPLPDRCHPDHG